MHTSVGFTFRYLNNRHAALANRVSPDGFAMDMAWFAAPGDDDAIRFLQEREAVNPLGQLRRGVLAAFRAYMEGDRKASLDAVEGTLALRFRDPEVLSSFGILLARQDAAQRALEVLSSASTEGYVAFCGLLDHPWLDSMRPHRQFSELVDRTLAFRSRAQTIFASTEGSACWESRSERPA